MGRYWYSFAGGNAHDESNYFLLTGKPGCTSGNTICAIYAPAGNFFPTPFSNKLNTYITAALFSPHLPQPTSGKYYLYLKS